MATGTFTYNTLRMKTLKRLKKKQRKALKPSNPARTMLLVHERLSLNQNFLYTQWALLGLQSIVIKCTEVIFFLTVDCGRKRGNVTRF